MARAATAASLNTQKPSPWSRCAWCVPPARFTPQPRGERAATGGDRRARGAPRALDHCRRPRKADALHGPRVQRSRADGRDVGRVMGARKLDIGRGRRNAHEVGRAVRDPFAQRRVLAHREAMAGRQRQDEVVGVVDQHSVDSCQLTVSSRCLRWRRIERRDPINANAARRLMRRLSRHGRDCQLSTVN